MNELIGATVGEKKRLLADLIAAKAHRARYNRLAYYRPSARQRAFHDAGFVFRERLFSAGNQLGKTYSGAFETAMHLTGRYPDWWKGRVFDRPTVGYAASETSELTRDGQQRLLFGRAGVTHEHGTGSIPVECIVSTSPRPGVPNAYSSAVIRWGGGGDIQARESVLNFRSYDQGREKFQADTVDFFWLDEEPDHDIYMECLTRTNAVEGPVYVTFTPLKGMSVTVMRFMIEKPAGTTVVTMGIYDSERYSKEQADRIVAQYPPHEREARAFGRPVLGSGAVFPVEQSRITCQPFQIPGHWPRIAGLDLGWDHPTAGAWLAINPDTPRPKVYVYDVYKAPQAPPSVHALVFRARGQWIPVAWPHDALQTQKDTGVPMRDAYMREGVNMLPERAQFEDGSYGVEPGVQIIYNMMMNGDFYVFSHLLEWFTEFGMYHRKDGKIVPLMDDLMSATRYAVMSMRFAQPEAVHKLNIYRSSWRA